MHELLSFWPVIGIVAVFIFVICLMLRWERKQGNTWTPVADGEFERAEYGYYAYSRRRGAMVHSTSYHRMNVTAVYFQDGRSHVINGRHSMPYPRGTMIRISRNNLGGHRLEPLV